MKLVIVESPAKTKKIAGYLGQGWQVEASFGHIRDLPIREIGVAGPDYFPNYVPGERSGKTIAKLKKLAQQADEIYLASDPDREGEAIAWHLQQVIAQGKPTKRISFQEITQTAVEKAINQPRQVDTKLFMAQQGRRVLDRLYGYKVSPILGNKLAQRGVSAGRVQSVALKLIVEREQAIQVFNPVNHYGLKLQFNTDNQDWFAVWDSSGLVNKEHPYILDKTIVESLLQTVTRSGVKIINFKESTQGRNPPAPLITSSLQQAAANKLNLSVDVTMKTAQSLFEAGLITYHRTDNPNLSQDAIHAIWDFLRKAGQEQHIPDQANTWKARGDAQEAHEAIRPTDFNTRKANTGDERQDKLYQMIWRASVASQMKSAVFKIRKAVLQSFEIINFTNVPKPQSCHALFNASGQALVYPGWMVLMKDDYTNEDQEENNSLPLLNIGDQPPILLSEILSLTTKPPRRFTEPSLVKALEREGIGRPSTYASIISVLRKRDYVSMSKKQFQPTILGIAIVEALKPHFSFMDVKYTKDMESQLDDIASGIANYTAMMKYYDQALDEQLIAFKADQKINTLNHDEPSFPCPECEQGNLRKIKGKNGYFWGCNRYQEGCQCIRPDDKGKPGEKIPVRERSTEHQCPTCQQGYLQQRKGKKGIFWGCERYPDCKQTYTDQQGKPNLTPEGENNDYSCRACGKGHLRQKKSKKGLFWACNQYPDCTHTEPDEKGKPKFATQR